MVVHPVSHGVSRVPRYSGIRRTEIGFRLRVSHPLWMAFPYHSANLSCRCAAPQPRRINPSVWPLPVSLATTPGISFDFSSSPYLDVSVREVPLLNLWIQLSMQDSSSCGFPHTDIRGSKPISGSPRLFAGYHVLLRLQVPRHSPYALFRLNSLFSSLELF